MTMHIFQSVRITVNHKSTMKSIKMADLGAITAGFRCLKQIPIPHYKN